MTDNGESAHFHAYVRARTHENGGNPRCLSSVIGLGVGGDDELDSSVEAFAGDAGGLHWVFVGKPGGDSADGQRLDAHFRAVLGVPGAEVVDADARAVGDDALVANE